MNYSIEGKLWGKYKIGVITMLRHFLKKLVQVNLGEEITNKETKINSVLHNNLEVIKKIYSIPDNSDVKIHNFTIKGLNKKAALFFISTISDVPMITEHIIEPLLLNEFESKTIDELIQVQSFTEVKKVKDAVEGANQGNSILFIDGEETAYLIGTAKFESRSVEKAENEVIVKGPKEAFNEKVTTNISLVRRKIKNENLIVETATVSSRSNNELFLLYLKDIADEKLLNNIKERVGKLDVDSVQNLSLLEQHIEERPKSIFPSILYTERPDRAVSFLEEGHIVLLMNNSPASLVLPATFWAFIHNPEDHYLRFFYGNFTRLLRVVAIFITLFASAIYVAVTNFHSEMVPTDLLLAISATREKVPFPSLVEILMMELAFELIREAGLRVPSPIGPTIGIVGALILGQAAVQANIVSPIIVIIVALGGLCSFVISDISMNFALRIIRLIFIIASGVMGIFGMVAFFMIGLSYTVSIKSFGVPYVAPMSPHYASSKDTIFRRLLKNEKFRPGYLNPKDPVKK